MTWQPIATAPKDRRVLLLLMGGWVTIGSYWHPRREGGLEGWVRADGGLLRPTHWMPLPDPPEVPS